MRLALTHVGCKQEPRDVIEVMALQADMLFEALKRDARMLRCVAVWLGTAARAHAPTSSAQWLHVLLHHLVDQQLHHIQEQASEVRPRLTQSGSGLSLEV